MGRLIFHARAHDGGLRHQQGHRLALHVGAHQGPVGVVVFQEGDHGRGHGYQLLGGNVHVVHLRGLHLDDLIQPPGHHTVPLEPHLAVLFHGGLVGLGHDEVVLLVGGQVYDLPQDVLIGRVHLPVGGLDKPVLIDAGIGGQGVDQADVGAFRGLDGAHTAIVGKVHVPHVEGGPLPVQAAGAQGGQPALVGQLRQGIGLVHELGKLGGAEKLLDGGGDRPDVDQAGGHGRLHILQAHPLPHHPLQAGHAHPDLVLQQLAYAANPAVAQVVDIVGAADAVIHADQVADGGDDVIRHDMPGDQVVDMAAQQGLEPRLIQILPFFQQGRQGGMIHLFVQARIFRIKGQISAGVHEPVPQHLDLFILDLQIDRMDTCVFHQACLLPADVVAGA